MRSGMCDTARVDATNAAASTIRLAQLATDMSITVQAGVFAVTVIDAEESDAVYQATLSSRFAFLTFIDAPAMRLAKARSRLEESTKERSKMNIQIKVLESRLESMKSKSKGEKEKKKDAAREVVELKTSIEKKKLEIAELSAAVKEAEDGLEQRVSLAALLFGVIVRHLRCL